MRVDASIAVEMANKAQELVAQIKPMLAGHPPELQGAVLADLVSIWLAGHHPEFRRVTMTLWVETTLCMIAPSERELFGDGPRPEGW